jgi:signal peptidase I
MRVVALLLALCAAAQAAPTLYTILPTGSMEPTFNEDYYILVEYRPFTSLRVGQIIVYRCEPFDIEGKTYDTVVHRVWRISSGGSVVITKGDANKRIDRELITESMLVGVVTGWVRIEDYFKPGAMVFCVDKIAQVGQY